MRFLRAALAFLTLPAPLLAQAVSSPPQAAPPTLEEVRLGMGIPSVGIDLRGQQDAVRAARQAADAAARVEGVAEVVDRIDTGERDDETLLASVEALVGRRSLSRVSGVFEVRVEAGVVTLEGTVSRFSEKRRAERLVLGINGVREFVDLLSVVPASPDLEIPLR